MEGENKEGFSSQGTKIERLASVPFVDDIVGRYSLDL